MIRCARDARFNLVRASVRPRPNALDPSIVQVRVSFRPRGDMTRRDMLISEPTRDGIRECDVQSGLPDFGWSLVNLAEKLTEHGVR